MAPHWITNPLFWLAAMPALAVSGVLMQMIMSLFRCCGAFRFRGRAVQVTWWMIPATIALCCTLWLIAAAVAWFG